MGIQVLIDIHKQFGRKAGQDAGPRIEATLSVGDVPVTVLFGPSGCGKTTVLRCIAGVETPDHGSIRCGTHTWFDSAARVNIPPQQRRIGYVIQEQSLFPHLTVRANIAYGVSRPGRTGRRIDELIDLLDLSHLQHRRPSQLSGGQRQRVALARALAPGPQLLLLDEPLASLDAPAREELRAQLRSLILRVGTPALLVTHDRAEALALGDEIAVMSAGRIVQTGPVQQVFNSPADPGVAAAVGMETVIPGRIISSADGLCEVSVGAATLTALHPLNCDGDVLICIRGEDVALRRPWGEQATPQRESARNRLPARVQGIRHEGPLVRIFLDCGFALTALVTRPACEELNLTPGALVTAVIKAPGIHLIPRQPAAPQSRAQQTHPRPEVLAST